jgi:hypothetical protein
MTPLPSWFRPYAEIEAVARQIRSWEPSVVPGLLQTEQYARGMLATLPNTTEGPNLPGVVAVRDGEFDAG